MGILKSLPLCILIIILLFTSSCSSNTGSFGNDLERLRLLASSNLSAESCADKEDSGSEPIKEDYQSAKSNIESMRSGTAALDAMASSDWNQYLDTLLLAYLPLILMSGAVVLFLLISCFQTFNSTSCKRNLELKPYSNCGTYVSIAIAIITAAAVIGMAFSGLEKNRPLVRSMNRGACASLKMIDRLIQGVPSKGWLGIDSIENKLTAIKNQLTTTSPTQYVSPFSSSSFLLGVSSLQTEIYSMQTALSVSSLNVQLPNPNRGSNVKSVKPDLLYLLGTPLVLDQSKVLGSLEQEYQSKAYLETSLLLKLKNSASIVAAQTSTITSTIDSAKSQVSTLKNQISSFSSLIQTRMNSAKSTVKFLNTTNICIYALSITFGILGVISIGIMLSFKIVGIKSLIYATWIGFSLLSVISFIAAAYSYSLSIGLCENCSGLAAMTSSKSEFEKYSVFINAPELSTCFFSNGNLTDQLSLYSAFKNITEVSSDLANIDTQSSIFNEETTSAKINYWITQLNSYEGFSQDGVLLSSAESGFQTYDLPSTSLNQLNSWSSFSYIPTDGSSNQQQQINCGTLSLDKVVFKTSQCSSLILCSSAAPGIACCIPLESTAYDSNFINTRLASITNNACSSLSTYKQNYYDFYMALYTYTQGIISTLSVTVSPLFTQYKIDQAAYMSQVKQLYSVVASTFRDSTAPVSEMIQSKTSGISYTSQCDFLKADFEEIQNSLCKSSMVRVYQSSVVLIVISCLLLFASIAFYVMSSRLIDYVKKSAFIQLFEDRKPHLRPSGAALPVHDMSLLEVEPQYDQIRRNPQHYQQYNDAAASTRRIELQLDEPVSDKVSREQEDLYAIVEQDQQVAPKKLTQTKAPKYNYIQPPSTRSNYSDLEPQSSDAGVANRLISSHPLNQISTPLQGSRRLDKEQVKNMKNLF